MRVTGVRSGKRMKGASIHHAALLLSDTSNRLGEIEERADTPLQSISTHYLGSLVRSALSPQTETITEEGRGRSYRHDANRKTDGQTKG